MRGCGRTVLVDCDAGGADVTTVTGRDLDWPGFRGMGAFRAGAEIVVAAVVVG